jgi:hypothetical protein
MTEERWSLIPEWENYEISTLGRVRRSDTGKPLRTHINDKGYPAVHLRMGPGRSKQMPIHTAVLTAFVGPKPSPKHQAAHRDGTTTNSILSNLRWATVVENMSDKRIHGTLRIGADVPGAILSEEQVRVIKSRPRSAYSGARLAEEFGVSQSTISLIRLGRNWSHVR